MAKYIFTSRASCSTVASFSFGRRNFCWQLDVLCFKDSVQLPRSLFEQCRVSHHYKVYELTGTPRKHTSKDQRDVNAENNGPNIDNVRVAFALVTDQVKRATMLSVRTHVSVLVNKANRTKTGDRGQQCCCNTEVGIVCSRLLFENSIL